MKHHCYKLVRSYYKVHDKKCVGCRTLSFFLTHFLSFYLSRFSFYINIRCMVIYSVKILSGVMTSYILQNFLSGNHISFHRQIQCLHSYPGISLLWQFLVSHANKCLICWQSCLEHKTLHCTFLYSFCVIIIFPQFLLSHPFL